MNLNNHTLLGLIISLCILGACGSNTRQDPDGATGHKAVNVKIVADNEVVPIIDVPQIPVVPVKTVFEPQDPLIFIPNFSFAPPSVGHNNARHSDDDDDDNDNDADGDKNNYYNENDKNISWLHHWNKIALDASGYDHWPSAAGEQKGPARASRAIAIVHIAIFEAVNAIAGDYESYLGLKKVNANASLQAAIAQAAYETLAALFPSQKASFEAKLFADLNQIQNGPMKQQGIEAGKIAAQKILSLRQNDGAQHKEPIIGVDFIPSTEPGKWRPDPISELPIAMGALWGTVKPFVMASSDQFRAPAPPALTSAEYAIAYNQTKNLGGNGTNTPTQRTEEQTDIGIYWAYDGMPSLCAPPRLYNQIVSQVAEQMNTDFVEFARLLALINIAMADAAIAAWESKYFYQVWRPVTAIRESDPGTGPSGLGDGNNETIGDVNFTPLGSPASNLTGPDFTPPFPGYPSGHATLGGAVFQVLRKVFNRDDIAFTFVSEEQNGVTRDNQGNIRPLKPRHFSSLSEAEEENGQSRIYIGVHFSFDKTEGIAQGRRVGDYVLDNLFKAKNARFDTTQPKKSEQIFQQKRACER